jgi:hypothetical protein
MLPSLSASGVVVILPPAAASLCVRCESTDTGVPFTTGDAYAVPLCAVPPSSKTDSSSGASSISSRIGETVPTTRLLFSMERTTSSRSGLSSSSSPSSSFAPMFEPRFLLPRCGVAVCALGVFPRFELLLGWVDALRWGLAEPFARRGVVRTGVRRADGCGGSEACFAGRAPRAPKLKPKDACTADGLAQSKLVWTSVSR